jgi:ribosomal protein L22
VDIKQLKDYLDSLARSLKNDDRRLMNARLKSLISVFPFNEYEYALMFLLDKRVIGFEEYEKLRNNYVSSNRYLDLYGLAPRIFGEIWGHEHIKDLDGRFIKPDKSIDPEYAGQYDLLIEDVRVELKAARAINTKVRGNLVSKALQYVSSEPFWMNFQQIKFDVSDIFIFVGVWADEIVYWAFSNNEVKNNKYLSHQHRGGIEYQIGITDKNIADFNKYRVSASELANKVIEIAKGDL